MGHLLVLCTFSAISRIQELKKEPFSNCTNRDAPKYHTVRFTYSQIYFEGLFAEKNGNRATPNAF